MSLPGIASAPDRQIRVAMVTNIPAPYRIPVFERVARQPGCDLQVVYCSGTEPDRAWQLRQGSFGATFLKARIWSVRGRYVHVNPDVWPVLSRLQPDVVITSGFNPTHLLAFAHARLHGTAHVPMTDGTDVSEATLTGLHRWLRRRIYAGSGAFIGASEGSMALYRSYGLPDARLFKSHLCADNEAYFAQPEVPRVHDLMVSGRIVAGKNPLFALQVAQQLSRRLGRVVSLAFLGSGEMEAEVRAAAERVRSEVDTRFLGFVQQAQLPAQYASARVLLFPTALDTWGVVANEAMAAGTPVIVTPQAGVAADLVLDGVNGRVLPLALNDWVDAAEALLRDEALRARWAQAGRERVAGFNFDAAADGIWQAVQAAMQTAVEGRRHG